MKNIYLLLFVFLINSIAFPQVKNINPEFHRTWLRYEFYNDIQSGKTPRESMKMQPLMQLYFFEDNNQVLFCSFSEGMTAQYLVKNRDTIEVPPKPGIYGNGFVASLVKENNEVKLLVDDGEEKMIFKGLDKKYYDRNGVVFFVNDKLISGNYISSTDSSMKIKFSIDGSIDGIANYFEYTIPLLGFELPPDFDTIILRYRNNGRRYSDVYHFKKSESNLSLYNVSTTSDNLDDPFRYYNGKIKDKYLELIKIENNPE